MMSIFITTLVLTLPLYIFTQETCPKEYLRFTPEHSFCKPPNPSCQFVVKGMISKEKSKEIVEIHNRLRNKIAVGEETLAGGLPTASDMLAFSWDNELAQIAQKWIEQCLFDHDCPECRATRKFAVGQNVGYTWDPCTGNCDSVEPNWEKNK
uniref:U21-Theriditoxin-Lha1d_1 n=1 Tax=Latrodectus hasselti TaxID=256736 RepID=A0A482ZAC1_LATHA